MTLLAYRQGHACQPRTTEPDEVAEAEHHVVKAARKEELSPRLTPQGQALLQASRAVTRTVQPSAASMREAYLHSLGLKCVLSRHRHSPHPVPASAPMQLAPACMQPFPAPAQLPVSTCLEALVPERVGKLRWSCWQLGKSHVICLACTILYCCSASR